MRFSPRSNSPWRSSIVHGNTASAIHRSGATRAGSWNSPTLIMGDRSHNAAVTTSEATDATSMALR